MKSINEIKPFVDEQEIFCMPEVRIIGKAYRCKFTWEDGECGAIWDSFCAAADKLDALPRVVSGVYIAWTGEDTETDGKDYTYMPAIICPAGTPVPEGLDYRDLPASFVAKGVYGENINQVVEKLNLQGYKTCYTKLRWNAEFYFEAEDENPPKENCSPFRWLVPCVKNRQE